MEGMGRRGRVKEVWRQGVVKSHESGTPGRYCWQTWWVGGWVGTPAHQTQATINWRVANRRALGRCGSREPQPIAARCGSAPSSEQAGGAGVALPGCRLRHGALPAGLLRPLLVPGRLAGLSRLRTNGSGGATRGQAFNEAREQQLTAGPSRGLHPPVEQTMPPSNSTVGPPPPLAAPRAAAPWAETCSRRRSAAADACSGEHPGAPARLCCQPAGPRSAANSANRCPRTLAVSSASACGLR